MFTLPHTVFTVSNSRYRSKMLEPSVLWVSKQKRHFSVVVVHQPKQSVWVHAHQSDRFVPIGSLRVRAPGFFQLPPNRSLVVCDREQEQYLLLVERTELAHNDTVRYRSYQIDIRM